MYISKDQADAERAVYDALKQHSPNTTQAFVAYLEPKLGKLPVRELLAAIIALDCKRWPLLHAETRLLCPELCRSLDALVHEIERHRAGFIETAALRVLKTIAKREEVRHAL